MGCDLFLQKKTALPVNAGPCWYAKSNSFYGESKLFIYFRISIEHFQSIRWATSILAQREIVILNGSLLNFIAYRERIVPRTA